MIDAVLCGSVIVGPEVSRDAIVGLLGLSALLVRVMEWPTGGMFLREEALVSAPVDVARGCLIDRVRVDGLCCASDAACSAGQVGLVEAGLADVVGPLIVETVPAYQRGPVTVIPIRWFAAGPVNKPILEANIELHPDGEGEKTQLVLTGICTPPTDRADGAVAQVLVQQAARAIAQAFLAQLTEVIITSRQRTLLPESDIVRRRASRTPAS